MPPPPPEFWADFARSMSMNPGSPFGAGIDHHTGPQAGPFGFGFPFGPSAFPSGPPGPHPPHWGPPGGPGGHHRHPHHGQHGGRHHHQPEGEAADRAPTSAEDAGNDAASATMRGEKDNETHPDPPEVTPGQIPPPPGYDAHPWAGFFGGMRGGWGRGRGRRGWGRRSADIQGWQTYLTEAMRSFQEGLGRNASGAHADDEAFSPPVDIFSTGSGWVLHVALPGAKKEDVRVSWDADKDILTIGGLVYRPGSEEFISGLVSGERRVGMFERQVRLPPKADEGEAGEKEKHNKDEIDAEGITAKMEDGILIVNVPCVEKEWTEVRKVDIM